MRASIENIIYSVLGFFFIAGIVIMYGVSRASAFNILFFAIGSGLTIIPIFIITQRTDDFKNKKQKDREKDYLKKYGDKLEVDLSKCAIKTNSWTSQHSRYSDGRISMLNAIGGDSELNIIEKQNSLTLLKFSANYKGRKRQFSCQFAKETHTPNVIGA